MRQVTGEDERDPVRTACPFPRLAGCEIDPRAGRARFVAGAVASIRRQRREPCDTNGRDPRDTSRDRRRLIVRRHERGHRQRHRRGLIIAAPATTRQTPRQAHRR